MSILAYVIYYVCMSAMNLMCSSRFSDLFCSVHDYGHMVHRNKKKKNPKCLWKKWDKSLAEMMEKGNIIQ